MREICSFFTQECSSESASSPALHCLKKARLSERGWGQHIDRSSSVERRDKREFWCRLKLIVRLKPISLYSVFCRNQKLLIFVLKRIQVRCLLLETKRISTNSPFPRTYKDSHPSCSCGSHHCSSGFLSGETLPCPGILTNNMPWPTLGKESRNMDER